MKITKVGHSCLVVETKGTKILVDPGIWNKMSQESRISAILLTHEHPDHSDPAQIKEILSRNPDVRIITHESVGTKLDGEGIKYEIIEPGQSVDVNGVSVESYGTEHAAIYKTPPCRNTGFLIDGDLFSPGDALHDIPPKPVRILALPTGGPWLKFIEAVDYAKALKPEWVFPIHDSMYTEEFRGGRMAALLKENLEPAGIKFIDMPAGAVEEI